jgi:hypothetical protein
VLAVAGQRWLEQVSAVGIYSGRPPALLGHATMAHEADKPQTQDCKTSMQPRTEGATPVIGTRAQYVQFDTSKGLWFSPQ